MNLKQAIHKKKELSNQTYFKKDFLRYKILVLDIVYYEDLEIYDVKMTNREVDDKGLSKHPSCAYFYYKNDGKAIIFE
jgi:hypothetical protein